MPTMWQRDLDADRAQLTAWLARRLPDATDVRVTALVAPQSSGFSNDTLLFDLEYTHGGRSVREPLVVRIEPTGFQVFPEYDLSLQFRTMQRLAKTSIPVPTHALDRDRGSRDTRRRVLRHGPGERSRAARQSALPRGRMADGGDAGGARADLVVGDRDPGGDPHARLARARLRGSRQAGARGDAARVATHLLRPLLRLGLARTSRSRPSRRRAPG